MKARRVARSDPTGTSSKDPEEGPEQLVDQNSQQEQPPESQQAKEPSLQGGNEQTKG